MFIVSANRMPFSFEAAKLISGTRAMGILGIGVDIVQTIRLQKTYEKYGERFLNRYLHLEEIQQFQSLMSRNNEAAPMQFLASRHVNKDPITCLTKY